MLLKLITASVLSIGLATSALAQASGASGGTSGSSQSGGTSTSDVNASDKDKDAAGKQDSSDCVQGKTAKNEATKPVPGTAKDAAGNCQ
ncbi:hypothetical protein [Rhizobium sullae]|uniref:Oxidoreductase n=1 Tax=Rhizobium sullae TaxID=50338 RepID=A0A4R3PRJ6_RHISU|nr:hypothetical protein [Rhizobium sullae]TCU04840.1 hypothetical protein EV132_13822 [Rhizobium sullae]